MTEEWRKLHIEELNDLYFSLDIVRVIKSRRMRWAGHVARIVERRGVYTAQCNTIMQHKSTKCAFCKLIF